jgi:hypothetical protein
MNLPITRLSPWYPGQMGVPGSDVPRGIRSEPTALALFVSTVNPAANAFNDGTDPENPISTVQMAVNRLITMQTALGVSLVGSKIVVDAGSTITENVIIPITAPKGCSIVGSGSGSYSPVWNSASASTVALTIRQENWRISGFTFTPPATSSSIKLEWTGATANASGAIIEGNVFSTFQAAAGKYAIEFSGAPYNVKILNNEFSEFADGASGGYGIICTNSSTANPLLCTISGNVFREIDNGIGSLGNNKSFNSSLFADNVFCLSPQIAMTLKLDLRGGSVGHNTVIRNTFPGDYSNVGGYYDNAAHASVWIGNLAEDVTEAEVGDNGFTILPPA